MYCHGVDRNPWNLQGLDSEALENLLLGTAAVESNLKYRVQRVQLENGEWKETGPGYSFFQIEGDSTYNDMVDKYFNTAKCRKEFIKEHYLQGEDFPSTEELKDQKYDKFSAAIALNVYLNHLQKNNLEKLEGLDAADTAGAEEIWKKYYYTDSGDGTESKFIENYNMYFGN